MKIKAFFLIILTVVSLFFICRSWDYKEYESLALVSAVGFDTDDSVQQVTVTLQYLVPGGGNSSQSAGGGGKSSTGTAVVKATGPSIDDALTKIQQVTDKKLFYAYMKEIVIGQNAAKHITGDIIRYINCTPNIRNSSYVCITPGKAEDVLKTANPNVSEPSSKNIHGLIDDSINSGNAYPVNIEDFLVNMMTRGKEPVAPGINVVETKQSSKSNSSNSSSGDSSEMSSSSSFNNMGNSLESGAVVLNKQKDGYFKLNGIAAFKDDKLVGWLEGKECVGLGWITNKKYYVYEIVKTSSEKNIMNTMIFRVTNSNCKIKIELEDDKPVIHINAHVEADLRKFSNNVTADYFTPDVITMMEKGLADNVRAEINAAIKKSQNLKTDILDIGFDFYRQYPLLWNSKYEKKWEQIFPGLQMKVDVSAKVIDTGTSIRKQ